MEPGESRGKSTKQQEKGHVPTQIHSFWAYPRDTNSISIAVRRQQLTNTNAPSKHFCHVKNPEF